MAKASSFGPMVVLTVASGRGTHLVRALTWKTKGSMTKTEFWRHEFKLPGKQGFEDWSTQRIFFCCNMLLRIGLQNVYISIRNTSL